VYTIQDEIAMGMSTPHLLNGISISFVGHLYILTGFIG